MERCGIRLNEASNDEEESMKEVEPQGHVNPVRLFKLVLAVSFIPQLEVSTYDRNINVEELIDWINMLDKYFNYEKFNEAKKVKFVVMNFRGHASIWWYGVQADKRSKGKHKIKS